jgi:hypothetical protein
MADNRVLNLSSPRIFLLRMLVFLILIGFIGLILYRQIGTAFMANPGLNGLIAGVLVIGILLGLRQVLRLFREIRWVNALPRHQAGQVKPPILLAPMAKLLGDKPHGAPISTLTLRAILDSIGTRLDESRETARYLTGLLIFLGLLGTFWGLLETVGSIGGVIKSMQTGADAAVMFDDLKNGLSAPIAGMSISFTSSLFGLAGSLILGFLDLQAGQAQNRFYTELEDNLTASTADPAAPGVSLFEADGHSHLPHDLQAAMDKIAAAADQGYARANAIALANLADGIQALVQHMRTEQQMIRDWVEAQSEQSRELKSVLARLASELTERR